MKFSRKASVAVLTAAFLLIATAAWAALTKVSPGSYDPASSFLVQSTWLGGIGCPTTYNLYDSDFNNIVDTPATDPACATGAAGDTGVQGLLMAKTGPTGNNAAAFATLKGVKNTNINELGYDIRKPNGAADLSGSHCGAGAPRFNVTDLSNVTYFIGCNSPSATTVVVGSSWLRLRWGAPGVLMAYGPSGLTNIWGFGIKSVDIVFDEGSDTGTDFFGMAVLDNIDYNGVLIGKNK